MVAGIVRSVTESIDKITGVKGSFGYMAIAAVVLIGHTWMNSQQAAADAEPDDKKKEDEEADPPRNFTMKQLLDFDGTNDAKTGEPKPVYLSVRGTVFDVSEGRNFYGPGGPYEGFAGHECGLALARMSLDTKDLDDFDGLDSLNFGEKIELEGWIEKFTYYRRYPIKGKLVPDKVLDKLKDRVLTKDDIAKYNGECEDIPEGYAAAPIYLGAGDKVYDVSFGGIEFYGRGCGYNRFAGKDASRALAKMSFEPADVESSSIDDLNDKQKKVLSDWVKTFEERKGYPVVGTMKK